MSTYSTGEIAKLCNSTVRTVQYYDTRGILIPSEFSENGRRLYNEKDVQKLKTICFLRQLDFSIDQIQEILQSNCSEEIICMLIHQQTSILKEEINQKQRKLKSLDELSSNIKAIDDFSFENLGDIISMMENKNKLYKLHYFMNLMGIFMILVGVTSIILWIKYNSIMIPIIGVFLIVVMNYLSFHYFYKKTSYVCVHCHKVFKPNAIESFFAGHTPTTRNLTCTNCHQKSFHIALYDK